MTNESVGFCVCPLASQDRVTLSYLLAHIDSLPTYLLGHLIYVMKWQNAVRLQRVSWNIKTGIKMSVGEETQIQHETGQA